MISVLHITPHLGGGVGRVLLNHLEYACSFCEESHSIISLEDANLPARARAAELGIRLEDRMASRIPELLKELSSADVVVIHWWNHPLLYSLLVRVELPPSRLFIWSHVNGHFPTQNFTDALIAFPDHFVVATPYSLEAPAIQRLTPTGRRNQIRLVFSCAGISHVADVKPVSHDGFRVGYVGTVDYCKMHPRFIQLSAAVDIHNVRFVVCGGPHEDSIRTDACRSGVGDRFEFFGHVNDVAPVLANLDVFGYPLAPKHYGTGEQALIEALACGVPPVVLANGPEQYVVEDGVTGIIASDETAYTRGIELLYRQPEKRFLLRENARRHARENFTIERLARSWSQLYRETLQFPKRTRRWPDAVPEKLAPGAHIFLASLGEHGIDYAESMCEPNEDRIPDADECIAHGEALFRSRTRGSVFHYQRFFPDDPFLNYWCGLILQAEGAFTEAMHYFVAANNSHVIKRTSRFLDYKM